jgi:Na+-transporting NADH:ubiquinone oxidoreductase subunit NqrF
MLHTVLFRKENVTVHVPEGTNLRQAASTAASTLPRARRQALVPRQRAVRHLRRGRRQGRRAHAAGKREAKYLKKHATPGLRLSCQCAVKGDVIVTTDPEKGPAWKSHPFYSGRPVRSWESAA